MCFGVFGRENVFAATLWHLGGTDDRYINGAFAMYRNYDGAAGRSATHRLAPPRTSAPVDASVYAGVDAADPARMTIVLINRTASARSVGLAITQHAAF